ncbi:glycosyltransferase family 1 protein [Trametes coccinea BRFM310]|uniref:Glycosyltransferase family 1 protein n=1 Tax=Trametes coccinea (strain BRFM310) TaxID=1353009 RepID=A0A1Y2IJ60_TRAC3|nr:glycosyltransferase family 1 protein [Trametes coccinea BRFM310]
MSPSIQPSEHILVVPLQLWGHIHPLCILAARMIRMRPTLTLTICVAFKSYARAKTELIQAFESDQVEDLSRIRLISMNEGEDALEPAPVVRHFLEIWNSLRNGQAVPVESLDGRDGIVLDVRSTPLNAVLIDKERESSPEQLHLNLFTWLPVASNCIPPHFRKDRLPIAQAMVEHEHISFMDAAYSCACMPPMYDYELSPQVHPTTRLKHSPYLSRMFQQTDGVLTIDAADYHPEATQAMREWLAETGRKMYYAGPLVPDSVTIASPNQQEAEGSHQLEVLDFLNEQLRKSGERSVIYVSFGSLFWPTDPSKLIATLEVLMELNMPFIITQSSPYAGLSSDFVDFVQSLKEWDNAFVAKWVPQQVLLKHPAIGWCLTHGGLNTIMECIAAGVPMIVWPVVIDQVTNAIHISENLKIAYELLEVRNGWGLRQIYRTRYTPIGTTAAVRDEVRDVLTRAFGADGEAKRERLALLRSKLSSAWRESGNDKQKGGAGTARREVEAFLHDSCGRGQLAA